jgi:hypothetical protein
MAPRQPLETSTETWGDLFSNGKKYVVPRFQREYSWGEDQWRSVARRRCAPPAPWTDAFSADDRERFTQRLGNLTLLEPRLNRVRGSSSIGQKVETYAKSSYAMTRAIVSEEWNPASVRARQEDLARRAVRAFRLDT